MSKRWVLVGTLCLWPVLLSAQSMPNFIIILTDNQGWQDLGAYGSPDIETPHIDRMAAEGIRFTDFYSQPACGPSRAALMTGSYPPRVSMAFSHVPKARTGIHPDEVTLAELLKQSGYATALVGKWHLGDHPAFLPRRHGFDRFFGIPYSNDMWPFHPMTRPTHPLEHEPKRLQDARRRAELTGFEGQPKGHFFAEGKNFPDLPLYDDDEVVELNPDTDTLTGRLTEQAIAFIEASRNQPFFLYLAHAMPHTPLGASERFRGSSRRGLYGDVIAEIDWSVGEILAKLQALGLDEQTLVVYASDNGPWQQYGIDSGTSWPFRGGISTVLEGAVRVPAIARWPGHVPPGVVSEEVAGLIDIYPTFAALADSPLPEVAIDGKDISPLLLGSPEARSPHAAIYYYVEGPPGEANLQAIRSGTWKLHLRHKRNARFFGLWEDPKLVGHALYDLTADPTEVDNVIDDHADVVRRLEMMAARYDEELSQHIRPLGTLD